MHCWATDTDDQTVMPRWGKVGKQRIVDEGPLAPYPDMSNVPNMHEGLQKAKYNMTTFDEVLVENSKRFMDKAKKDGQAVLPLAQHDAHARLDLPLPEVRIA